MSRSNWVIVGEENEGESPEAQASNNYDDLEAPLSHLIEKQRRLSNQQKHAEPLPPSASADRSESSESSPPWSQWFWFAVAATAGIVVFYFLV